MTLDEKLAHFSRAIEHEATKLALVFVQGPGPNPSAAPTPSINPTNGQRRGVYLFAVAEGVGAERTRAERKQQEV